MKFELISKFEIGDKVIVSHCEEWRNITPPPTIKKKAKIIDIRLSYSNQIVCLCEYESLERKWVDEAWMELTND